MFRLAERLGMTVGQLGVEMDSAEFSAWHAYDRREARLRSEEEAELEADEERRRNADEALGEAE
jgi:hypothetical protein